MKPILTIRSDKEIDRVYKAIDEILLRSGLSYREAIGVLEVMKLDIWERIKDEETD